MLFPKENKESTVKAQKSIALKEKAQEKVRARKKDKYQILKKDHPDILQMRLRKQRIKCIENPEYGEKHAQQVRTSKSKSQTASKNFAIASGTFKLVLSPEGVALVKSSYIAWKGSHSTMRGFYKALNLEKHALLKGYDRQRLVNFCNNNKFSSLPVVFGQMDNAEGETSETILESGMIEDQVMPALPPLPTAV